MTTDNIAFVEPIIAASVLAALNIESPDKLQARRNREPQYRMPGHGADDVMNVASMEEQAEERERLTKGRNQ